MKSIHHINIGSSNVFKIEKKKEEDNNLLNLFNPHEEIEISIPIDDVEFFSTPQDTKNDTKSKDLEESQLSEELNEYLLKKRKIPNFITFSNQKDKKCHICKKECDMNKN